MGGWHREDREATWGEEGVLEEGSRILPLGSLAPSGSRGAPMSLSSLVCQMRKLVEEDVKGLMFQLLAFCASLILNFF